MSERAITRGLAFRIVFVAIFTALCCWLLNVWWVRLAVLRTVGDAYDWQARRLLGSRGVNCGRAEVGTGSRAANDCAMGAFLSGKAFRVRYDLQAYDSDVSAGLVRTKDGHMYALMFDGDPWGGGGTSLMRQRVITKECPQPLKLRMSIGNRLTCFPPVPSAQQSIMDPNFEPY